MKTIVALSFTVLLILVVIGFVASQTRAADQNKINNMNAVSTTKNVSVRLLDSEGHLSTPTASPRVIKTDAEWKKQLTSEQYRIARAKGTEPAFCGNLLDQKKSGVYFCVCCGLPLFASDTKFHSGTGWPSFFRPIADENIATHTDRTFGMDRTEILCARCDCHLGHVFEDGPKPSGLRYCLNSASLLFKENKNYKESSD